MQRQALDPTNKSALRHHFLAARRSLPPEEAKRLSTRAQERVIGLDAWREARQVMLYSAVRAEVATGMLIAAAFAAGKEVLLPRCRPEEKGVMDAAAISCLGDLRPGLFGIPEPDPLSCPTMGACRPDLIVVPAVAFDRRGFRLGYGGGYYDRFLARHLEISPGHGRGTMTLGLGYALQLVDALPTEAWDHPLDAVVTEEECLWIDHA